MITLINSILNKDYVSAESIISEEVELILARKLNEAKKSVAAKMCEQGMNRTGAELVRLDVVEEDNIDEDMFSLPGLKPTQTASGKADMPTGQTVPKINPEQQRINDILTRNTKEIIRKNQFKTIGKEPLFRSMEEEADEPGEESSMARSELNAITKDAKTIMSKVKGNKELEAWTQSKITKAADYLNSVANYMSDEEKEQLDEARVRIIKARIRGGKIQRRKKISNVIGMTLRGGKLQRMSTAERRRRKMGARKAARKRKTKMSRILMKRKRSLIKRRSLGL